MEQLRPHDNVLVPVKDNPKMYLSGTIQSIVSPKQCVVFINTPNLEGYRRVELFNMDPLRRVPVVINQKNQQETMSKDKLILNKLAYILTELNKDTSNQFKLAGLQGLQPKPCRIKDLNEDDIPSDVAAILSKRLKLPSPLKQKLIAAKDRVETHEDNVAPQMRVPTKEFDESSSTNSEVRTVLEKVSDVVVDAETSINEQTHTNVEETLEKAKTALKREAEFKPKVSLDPWVARPYAFIRPHSDVWGTDKGKEFVELLLTSAPKLGTIVLIKVLTESGTKYRPCIVDQVDKKRIVFVGYIDPEQTFEFTIANINDGLSWAPLDVEALEATAEFKKYTRKSKRKPYTNPTKEVPMKNSKTGIVKMIPRNLKEKFIKEGWEPAKKWMYKKFRVDEDKKNPIKPTPKKEKAEYSFRDVLGMIGIMRREKRQVLIAGDGVSYTIKKYPRVDKGEISERTARAMCLKDKKAEIKEITHEFPNKGLVDEEYEPSYISLNRIRKKLTRRPNSSKKKRDKKRYIPTGLHRAKLLMMKLIHQKATADATDDDGKFDEVKFNKLLEKEVIEIRDTTKKQVAESKEAAEKLREKTSKDDKKAANKKKKPAQKQFKKELEAAKKNKTKRPNQKDDKLKEAILDAKKANKLTEKPYVKPVEVPIKDPKDQKVDTKPKGKDKGHLKIVKK